VTFWETIRHKLREMFERTGVQPSEAERLHLIQVELKRQQLYAEALRKALESRAQRQQGDE
jgi:hypothetical protein